MKWDDERVEGMIGVLLRVGVLLAAGLVAIGGAIYLSRHGQEIPQYRSFHGTPQWGPLFSGRGLVMRGLIVLVLTPVARVAFSLVAFTLERDKIYVGITSIVLALLGYSLLAA